MTREAAKREIDFLDYYLQNHANDYSEESHTAMRMAYKALEEGDIVEKIRDKIEQFANAHCSGDDINIYDVFQIIDKYRK